MSTFIILVKLIAAHLLGDFIFQTDKMCADKFSSSPARKYIALLSHALVQALLTYVFVAEWQNWIIPTVIAVSHFVIDWIKTLSKRQHIIGFVSDQLAHYTVIICLWWIFFYNMPDYVPSGELLSMKFWLMFTAFIAVLTPTSILIKLFIEYEKWLPSDAMSEGLPNAGKWIGYLERILILTFIFTSNIEGIGFLLAAKSVFRFGELNRAKDIKTTEYVLIGTFASFTIAILIGFGVQYIFGYCH